MTFHLVTGSVAATLSLVLALFFVSVGRAPGWRHYHLYGLIALITSLYALLDLFTIQEDGSHWQSKPSAALVLMIALGSAVLWLRFDSQQEGRKLSRYERGASVFLLIGAALCPIPGVMIGDWHAVPTSFFDILYNVPSTTWLANIFIAVLLLTMIQLVVRYTYSAWNSNGSWLGMVAAFVYTCGEIEEGLVATGVLDWPFLGVLAFTVGILLMAVDLGLRVTHNAQQLAVLNRDLEARITRRTNELVRTREALISTERHAALGQLAAGVGHEVNNPLSYVMGNLDFLDEQLRTERPVEKGDEALAAINDARHGAERIRLVVDNLAKYARSAPITGAAYVENAVDVAMRVVRPQTKFTMRLDVQIDELPPVAIDESKLVQVLVNVLINSAQASKSIVPMPTTTIKAWQKGEDRVVIEIAVTEIIGRA